jgi:hypothetical protein
MRESKVRIRGTGALVLTLTASLVAALALAGAPDKNKPSGGGSGGGGSHATGGGSGGGGGSAGHGGVSTGGAGGGGAGHGVSTAGAGASHGVSTAGGGASHGVSTAGGGASHGVSTGGASHGATTGGSAAHTTAGGAGARGGGAAANHGASKPGGASFGGHAAPGGHASFAKNGSGVQRRADGRVSDVHDAKRGMDVHHGLDGSRRTERTLPGGGRVVAMGRGRGFVSHPYSFHGHAFGHRTYFAHGRAYDRFYGSWGYHGHFFDVYARAHYYPFGFYGYVYAPWAVPVVYAWDPYPWAPVYGYYYAPYAVYPAPAFWLADAIFAASLAAAYEAGQQAGQEGAYLVLPAPEQNMYADNNQLLELLFTPAEAAPGANGLSKVVKDMVAAEIRGILAQEQQEAQANAAGQDVDPNSGNIEKFFSDGRPHVLLVGAEVDVVAGSSECALTAGDVVSVAGLTGGDSVDARVLAAKTGGKECALNGTVSVAVSDLQDMLNSMREQVDDNLADLQKRGGSKGLPATPANAAGAPTNAGFANGAPGPDPDAAKQIAAANADSAQAEKDVEAQVDADNGGATGGGGGGGIQIGSSSVQDVEAAYGQPTRKLDFGAKLTYIYPDKRISFTNGVVSAIQ